MRGLVTSLCGVLGLRSLLVLVLVLVVDSQQTRQELREGILLIGRIDSDVSMFSLR